MSAGAKRHRVKKSANHEPLDRISKPGIRRLASRGGTKRVSKYIYPRARETAQTYLTNIIRDAFPNVLI